MSTKRIVIILEIIMGVIVILGGLVWGLVSLPSFANNSLVIKVKHYYYLNLAPKLGKNLSELPFSIEAVYKMKTDNGIVYLYTMLGKYQEVDDQNQILYLTTREKKIYGFHYAFMPLSELTYKTKGENGTIEQKFFSTEPLQEGDSMVVQWTDNRILEQILTEAEINPQRLINPYLTSDDFTVIVKN